MSSSEKSKRRWNLPESLRLRFHIEVGEELSFASRGRQHFAFSSESALHSLLDCISTSQSGGPSDRLHFGYIKLHGFHISHPSSPIPEPAVENQLRASETHCVRNDHRNFLNGNLIPRPDVEYFYCAFVLGHSCQDRLDTVIDVEV